MKLREVRLASGLTQAQLARAAGVAQATISRIETGTESPTLAHCERLASALRRRLFVLLATDKEADAITSLIEALRS